MTLFSAPNDPFSHRTRIVLAEKGISIDIVSVDSAPNTGGGLAAQIGTFATINNIGSPVGAMYLKTGSGNTAWDQIATGASGVNVGLGSQYTLDRGGHTRSSVAVDLESSH